MDDDEADFREFVTARWSSLVGTAYLITTDRPIAEDCVQEALTRVHRHWRRVRKDGKPAAYTHQAVVNAALSWRRRRRIREVPFSPVEHADGRALENLDNGITQMDDVLVAALRSLAPQMRAAVVLRYLEDRSEAETARLLGCSLGSVKSSTSRGVARLRSVLERAERSAADAFPTAAVPTDAVSTDAVSTDAVPTEAFPEGAR
jgi:RNA polymerase sigma-70 factor (sigma-E family)